jgi:hypothetical protein
MTSTKQYLRSENCDTQKRLAKPQDKEVCTMKDTERAQKIIDQKGSCKGIGCKNCPIQKEIQKECNALLEAGAENVDFREPNPAYVELAESYLLEKKYTPEVS